jgi:Spy/CpxP family protein refolding chaperone
MFVKCELRFVATAVVISTLSLTWVFASASALDDSSTPLAALQVKADQAQPKDRCFLYAKLISRLTDLAGHQLNSGDSGQASETLQLVQEYAEKIHVGVADDSKKLRDAELLMQRTTFRLQDILSQASYEDRQTLEATLKQLSQVQAQLMMQVFKK